MPHADRNLSPYKQRNGHEIHREECKVLKDRPLSNLTRLVYRLMKFDEKEPEKYDRVDGEQRRLTDLMDRKLTGSSAFLHCNSKV